MDLARTGWVAPRSTRPFTDVFFFTMIGNSEELTLEELK